MGGITDFLIFIVALLLALDVHEFAHAWVAVQLGDSTPRYAGRLTLNPIAHLDPLGTIMMLTAAFAGVGIGWGKPVPVNPQNMHRVSLRTGMGMTAFAGPVANLSLAVIVGTIFRALMGLSFLMPQFLAEALLYFLYIIFIVNVSLAMFNLIPIPPLDGHSVLLWLLENIRAPWAYNLSVAVAGWARQGPLLLLGLIFINSFFPILSIIIGTPINILSKLILGI